MNDAVAGAAAGLAQVTAGYPFDTVKVHYVQYGSMKGLNLNTLFRGVLSPIYGSVAINVQQFFIYNHMQKQYDNPLLSGAVAGAAISIIESPIELIKCRMQTGTETYTNCIRRIALDNPNKPAIQNLYRGFWATIYRNVPAVGIYFWSYNLVKEQFPNNQYTGAFVGGAVAGVACWAPNYPVDNWKTQIQADQKARPMGILQVAKKTGWRNSWRGFTPCIIRAGIVNPFVFLAYEFIKGAQLPYDP